MAHSTRGFSLVELAIVLVILGLLAGGILAGQTLIRASELRSVTTDLHRYETAVGAFTEKYHALPGDMSNAVSYWGAADGGDGLGSDCYSAASTSIATCNGNGDGVFSYTDTSYGNESFRFWQHLANAGLIEGKFTGVAATAGASRAVDPAFSNIPRSRVTNAGFSVASYGVLSGSAVGKWYWNGNYGNVMYFGSPDVPADLLETPVLTPTEQWNIDSKIDDGKPGTGAIVSYRNSTGCNDSGEPSVAEYALSKTGVGCFFMYLRAFDGN